VLEDQMEHLARASERRNGNGHLDLSLLTDGLRAEREQGITIDVAHRYFQTPRRGFIVADTPGHAQYTRNMVTGASTADLSIVLVDARKGMVEQSRRHAFIAALLGIPHVVVAVNKMDLVDYDPGAFERVVADVAGWGARIGLTGVTFIPISALNGDNVVARSERTPWYEGPALLAHLEDVEVEADHHLAPARFPVQWVVRPDDGARRDYRGYAGQVVSGTLRVGEDVVVLPSGQRSRIAVIETYDGALDEASWPRSVVVRLEDDIDVSRGDMLAPPSDPPGATRELEATVCWMADEPLRARRRYVLRHTTREVRAVVAELRHVLDVETLHRDEAATELELNAIGRVRLKTSAPVLADPYERDRATGGFILVDEATNETVGAGMVAEDSRLTRQGC
jgi:bifunctional enzyme CysN/CysC